MVSGWWAAPYIGHSTSTKSAAIAARGLQDAQQAGYVTAVPLDSCGTLDASRRLMAV
jgi:hypothetical protein